MRRRAHRTRTLLAAIAASITVLALTAQDTAAIAPASADLVATAHAAEGVTAPTDVRSGVGRLPRGGHARSTATASAGCVGCEGRARTVQVVYADGPEVAADNVAAAWSSCVDCAASSVAVQVVLLGRRTTQATLANRALAVNAACVGCTTSALAVQFVISGGSRRELTAQAKAHLAELATQLQLDLGTPWPGRGARSTEPDARALTDGGTSPEERSVAKVAESLRSEFGAGAVTVHLEVRHAA
jgi:hypothetical protein